MEWMANHGGSGSKQSLALTHLKNIALYAKNLIGGDVTLVSFTFMASTAKQQIRSQTNGAENFQNIGMA